MPAPSGSFDLAALARSRGFDDLAAAFEDESLKDLYYPLPDVPAPAIPDDETALLSLLQRYGLRPALLNALFDRWTDRPLDAGLAAWDAINQMVLSQSDEDRALAARCKTLVAPLAAILPPPGELCVDLAKHSAKDIVATHATNAQSADDATLERDAAAHSLVAIHALSLRPFGQALFARDGAKQALRDRAFLLNNARLSTLASVYVDLAFRHLGDPAAVIPLTEIFLDARADVRAPQSGFPATQTEPPFAGWAEYVLIRKLLVAKDFFNAKALADKHKGKWFRSSGIGVEVVFPEACGWVHQRAQAKRVEIAALASAHPGWRYLAAAKLFANLASNDDPSSEQPVKYLDEYYTGFGFAQWVEEVASRLLVKGSKAKRDMIRRTLTEFAASPWSRDVWEQLASMTKIKGPDAVRQRVIARIKEQATAARG